MTQAPYRTLIGYCIFFLFVLLILRLSFQIIHPYLRPSSCWISCSFSAVSSCFRGISFSCVYRQAVVDVNHLLLHCPRPSQQRDKPGRRFHTLDSRPFYVDFQPLLWKNILSKCVCLTPPTPPPILFDACMGVSRNRSKAWYVKCEKISEWWRWFR